MHPITEHTDTRRYHAAEVKTLSRLLFWYSVIELLRVDKIVSALIEFTRISAVKRMFVKKQLNCIDE